MAWIYGQFFPRTNSLWCSAYATIQRILGWGRSFRPDLVLFVTFLWGGAWSGNSWNLKKAQEEMYVHVQTFRLYQS